MTAGSRSKDSSASLLLATSFSLFLLCLFLKVEKDAEVTWSVVFLPLQVGLVAKTGHLLWRIYVTTSLDHDSDELDVRALMHQGFFLLFCICGFISAFLLCDVLDFVPPPALRNDPSAYPTYGPSILALVPPLLVYLVYSFLVTTGLISMHPPPPLPLAAPAQKRFQFSGDLFQSSFSPVPLDSDSPPAASSSSSSSHNSVMLPLDSLIARLKQLAVSSLAFLSSLLGLLSPALAACSSGVCVSAYASAFSSLLSALGVSASDMAPILSKLTAVLLFFSLASMYYFQRNLLHPPFLLAAFSSLLVVLGRALESLSLLSHLGNVLLVGAAVWNAYPVKKSLDCGS